jgi:hypothetical protein
MRRWRKGLASAFVDGQEPKHSVQGPDTEAQDLSPPDHHFSACNARTRIVDPQIVHPKHAEGIEHCAKVAFSQVTATPTLMTPELVARSEIRLVRNRDL